MQVSIPLALHLRSPNYHEARSISDFAFINTYSGRFQSTIIFASILRSIYNHPDWSQLHAFFTKRYSKIKLLSDRQERKLTAPEDPLFPCKDATVHFKTDPNSVGLSRDLPAQLAKAGRTARARIVGPDPQPYSIGPAISVAMGAGAYMDLTYMGRPPGEYSGGTRIEGETYGWEDGRYKMLAGAIATTKKGGRGRSWAEWADLWRVIAEWVYEHDSTALKLCFLNFHSYKYRLSDEERRKIGFGDKVPREYLATDAIDAADAILDVFEQLAAKPMLFQGIEWDFLEMEVVPKVREAFYARFGRKAPDHIKNFEALVTVTPQLDWHQLDYSNVSLVALKPCPKSFDGADWEAWMLSIEGGDVAVVRTRFQVLWAVMLLTQLPLTIEILDKNGKFPRFRDPESVYL